MDISAILNDKVCNEQAKKKSALLADLPIKPIVIFGCGNLGKKTGAFLLSKKYNLVAYSDNNELKWGSELNGVAILVPYEAKELYGTEAIFIVCIWSPERSYALFKKQLTDLGVQHIIHAAAIMLSFPDELLPYFHFQSPEYFLKHKKELTEVYNLLADEESKKQYLAHVDCRMTLNFEGLPVPDTRNQYFPADVIKLSDHEVFFDAGAYNGDTLQDFCERTKFKYARYIALEPDPENYVALGKRIDKLNAPNVDTYKYAVGSENCFLNFEATGVGDAGISDKGSIRVECVRIDDKFYDEAPTYLKFDIEGAELDALDGADRTIETYKPVLAVCIYHLPDDLWTIPLYLKNKYPFYNFFARTHQYDGLDFILYAIPK